MFHLLLKCNRSNCVSTIAVGRLATEESSAACDMRDERGQFSSAIHVMRYSMFYSPGVCLSCVRWLFRALCNELECRAPGEKVSKRIGSGFLVFEILCLSPRWDSWELRNYAWPDRRWEGLLVVVVT